MGSNTYLRPRTDFAHRLNAFFKAQIDERGWDASGRKMEAAVELDEPRRTVWAKFYRDAQAMNTNEIAIAARVFGMSAFEFVSKSKSMPSPDVGDIAHDGRVLSNDEERALRRGDVDLAALRGQNEAEIPHAE